MKTKLNKQKIIDKYAGGFINYLLILSKKLQKYTFTNKTIIIYKLDAIGDAILSLPMIKHLKEETKDRIIVACSNSNLPIFKKHKFIDKIVVFDTSKLNQKDLMNNVKKLRKERAKIAIDTSQSSNISAIMSRLTAKTTIGFKKTKGKSRNHVYDHIIDINPTKHMVFNYLNLLSPLGINYPSKIELVKLHTTKNILKGKFVGVHPCTIFPYKKWPADRWVEVIKYLSKKDDIITLGSKEEAPLVKEILNKLDKKVKKNILDVSGKLNIEQLISITNKLKLFIGLDGGPMHMAACMQIPTIGLFGHETPFIYRPFTKKSIALYKPTQCSPCVQSSANKKLTCLNPVCLKNITVNDVKKAIEELL